MPVVSEKQRRAMEAAKHGHSTLGIPKSVAQEFLANDAKEVKGHAAGIIHIAPDGSILLLHRSPSEENYAAHWALPGGKVEDGESPEDGADRETQEETGYESEVPKKLIDQRLTPNGMAFHTFVRPVFAKFAPELNDEHSGFTWARLDMLPQPLHPAVAKTLEERAGGDGSRLQAWAAEPDEDLAQDHALELAFDRAPDEFDVSRHGIVVTLAFDRDPEKRTDDFDRLHAKRVPITRACVNPYYGREIPRGRELGLEPDKVYRLLRDPDEIKKGAASSHNVPLLSEHVPHSADAHDGDITVGTVGSEAEYEHPFLYNSLAVWSRDGIDHVTSGSKKELSSAYSYDADMTPGNYEGEPYDGVMRNMVWNHVCLVKKGRAGSDVALDEAIQPLEEILSMTKLKSMKASVAYGALTAFLKPKLAMDASINLAGALATFEPKKFKESTPKFIAALKKSLAGKLAQDGDLAGIVEGVEKLMASIDGDKTVEDAAFADLDEGKNQDTVGQGAEEDTSMDSGAEALKAYLKSKGVPDDVIAGCPGCGGAEDELDEEAKKKAEEEKKKKEAAAGGGGGDKPDFVSKGAMDEALKKNADEVRRATIDAMNGVAEAREHVRPVVGDIKMAFDSAEGVYRQAFKMQNRDVSKVKEVEALKQMWDLVPAASSRPRQPIAQDSETVADFSKQFPNMAKVKRA